MNASLTVLIDEYHTSGGRTPLDSMASSRLPHVTYRTSASYHVPTYPLDLMLLNTYKSNLEVRTRTECNQAVKAVPFPCPNVRAGRTQRN
ncbi:hypothetical protein J6590_036430, partial [Homalodisca vitripennis]